MTLAAINWLSISIDLILVVFVIVCLLMTLLILMQRPKQEGLGAAFGGGVTDQVFGARTTDVLQRGTVYLGSLFFILSLVLAILIGQKNKTTSIVTKVETAAKVEKVVQEKTPEALAPKSLSEELPSAVSAPTEIQPAAETAAPPAEATPTPEVPSIPTGETVPSETLPPATETPDADKKPAGP